MNKCTNSTAVVIKNGKYLLIGILLLSASLLFSKEPPRKIRAYISRYAENAIEQMIEYRIPASVILAQAIRESNCGKSELAVKSKNHFGIKCHRSWEGDTVRQTDDLQDECFRKYANVAESYKDHSRFLISRPRYAFLFDLPLTDYKAWCNGLKKAGYATHPTYAEDLIRIIEEYKLYLFDTPEKKSTEIVQNRQLLKSNLTGNFLSLKYFASSGALFLNEKTTSIGRLNELVSLPQDPRNGIAEK